MVHYDVEDVPIPREPADHLMANGRVLTHLRQFGAA